MKKNITIILVVLIIVAIVIITRFAINTDSKTQNSDIQTSDTQTEEEVLNDQQNTDSDEELFFRMGELERKLREIDNENSTDVVIQAKDFKIDSQFLKNLIEQNQLSGISYDEAEQLALDQIIIKRSVYYYALDKGFDVDDKEVRKEQQANRETMKDAENYNDFEVYLKGFGTSEDKYYDMEFDLYKLNYVVGRFRKAQSDKFSDETLESENPDTNRNFDDYYGDIERKAIEIQEVKLDDSLNWDYLSD